MSCRFVWYFGWVDVIEWESGYYHPNIFTPIELDVKIYQETDVEESRCRHVHWGRRQA